MRAHAARQRDGEFITRDVGAPSRGWFPPNKKSDDGARQPAAPIFVLYPRRRGSRAPVPYRRGGRDLYCQRPANKAPVPRGSACLVRHGVRDPAADRAGRALIAVVPRAAWIFLCGVQIRRSLTARQKDPSGSAVVSCSLRAVGLAAWWSQVLPRGRWTDGTARPGHYSDPLRVFNSRSPTCSRPSRSINSDDFRGSASFGEKVWPGILLETRTLNTKKSSPNVKNSSPNLKNLSPKNPNIISGSKPRYLKLLRVIRV